jgi:hypothetical protein
MTTTPEIASTFQKRPAYRYVRKTDRMPTPAEIDQVTLDGLDKATAKIRLFNPTGPGTWWLAAVSENGQYAWGVAEIDGAREVGAIWLPELVDFRGRFGLPIERDLHYAPVTVADVMNGKG